MRPFTFSARYVIRNINVDDHTVMVKDLSMRRDIFGVWFVHPEVDQITLLRKFFSTRTMAASYALAFSARRGRLNAARVLAMRRPVPAPKASWWRRPWAWLRRG